jgi:hypothetical protein
MNCSVIFSTQYHLNLTTNERANLDLLFILRIRVMETAEKIAKTFLLSLLYEEFRELHLQKKTERLDFTLKWLEQLTEKHHMLVIDYKNHNKMYLFTVPFKKRKAG